MSLEATETTALNNAWNAWLQTQEAQGTFRSLSSPLADPAERKTKLTPAFLSWLSNTTGATHEAARTLMAGSKKDEAKTAIDALTASAAPGTTIGNNMWSAGLVGGAIAIGNMLGLGWLVTGILALVGGIVGGSMDGEHSFIGNMMNRVGLGSWVNQARNAVGLGLSMNNGVFDPAHVPDAAQVTVAAPTHTLEGHNTPPLTHATTAVDIGGGRTVQFFGSGPASTGATAGFIASHMEIVQGGNHIVIKFEENRRLDLDASSHVTHESIQRVANNQLAELQPVRAAMDTPPRPVANGKHHLVIHPITNADGPALANLGSFVVDATHPIPGLENGTYHAIARGTRTSGNTNFTEIEIVDRNGMPIKTDLAHKHFRISLKDIDSWHIGRDGDIRALEGYIGGDDFRGVAGNAARRLADTQTLGTHASTAAPTRDLASVTPLVPQSDQSFDVVDLGPPGTGTPPAGAPTGMPARRPVTDTPNPILGA